MATNYTTNYDLCQWESTDQVLRTDFNADNAKVDAALTALEAAKDRLEQAAINANYYVGRLALRDVLDNSVPIPQRAMLVETFQSSANKTTSGGAVIQNGMLTVSGTGTTGSMSQAAISVNGPDWTQARLWVHFSGGDISATLNGYAMSLVRAAYTQRVIGDLCFENEYVWNGVGVNYAQLTLDLNTGVNTSMKVYDYYIVFC